MSKILDRCADLHSTFSGSNFSVISFAPLHSARLLRHDKTLKRSYQEMLATSDDPTATSQSSWPSVLPVSPSKHILFIYEAQL